MRKGQGIDTHAAVCMHHRISGAPPSKRVGWLRVASQHLQGFQRLVSRDASIVYKTTMPSMLTKWEHEERAELQDARDSE